MTILEFNSIAQNAKFHGKLIKHDESDVFSPEPIQVEIFEFNGFFVHYQDGKFAAMFKDGKEVNFADCTQNKLDGYSVLELEQIILDAQKIIKQRKNEKAQEAINEFMEAWEKLKTFGDVRLRFNIQGKEHGHVKVSELDLKAMPLR